MFSKIPCFTARGLFFYIAIVPQKYTIRLIAILFALGWHENKGYLSKNPPLPKVTKGDKVAMLPLSGGVRRAIVPQKRFPRPSNHIGHRPLHLFDGRFARFVAE